MVRAVRAGQIGSHDRAANSCEVVHSTERKEAFSKSQLDSSSIVLLNWNILKGDRSSWKRDYRQISANMDLVLIQEAYLTETVLNGLNSERRGWVFSPSFIYMANQVPSGVLTASFARPQYCRALRATEPIIRVPKSSLVTKYRLSNCCEMLLVANVHAINFALGTGSFRSQARELKKELQNHTGPLILAGDFNTWSMRRVNSLAEVTEELGLRSVPFKTDLRKKVFKKPVDHIFFRGLDLVKARVIRVKSSDHNPMVVEFKVSGNYLAGSSRTRH
ncbi:endonuclease/exonuclease/phosphatase family protein [Syntrophobacteraceae bacterium DRH4]|nr:endonuclease/exonuclease/phosphatase family protein [Desulfoferrobacter suflitae]